MRREVISTGLACAVAMLLVGCAIQRQGSEGYASAPSSKGFAKARYDWRAAQAEMDVAMALITDLRYADAATLLEEVVAKTTPATAAPPQEGSERELLPAGRTDAMFWLGFCREKLGQKARAAEMYRAVIARGDQERFVAKATQRLAGLQEQ
ncbi:MAG: tetratricopeptide repeat protein [Phycisphaerae bacterium]